MAVLGFTPAGMCEEQHFHNIISFYLSATEMETTNEKAAPETGVDRTLKGNLKGSQHGGWQRPIPEPESSRGPGASVTTPGTKGTIVPDCQGHRHVAPSPKVWPFLQERLGRENAC